MNKIIWKAVERFKKFDERIWDKGICRGTMLFLFPMAIFFSEFFRLGKKKKYKSSKKS